MTTQNIAANPTPSPAPANGQSAATNDSNAPQKNHASGSLYVGDLAPDVTEALLFEIFNPVGPVSSIRVCRDSATRQSLGYAYVNFHNAQDAERALDTLNFYSIKGSPCRIMWSHRDPSLRKNAKSNIFIKNLDKTIDNKELYDTFSQFGSILSCKVAMDSMNNSKGYAFVHYADEAAAVKAIEEVNGKLIRDKKVFVAKHERRQDRQGSSNKFTNVYVKFVPEEWDLEKFRETFSAFGKITSCVLQADNQGKHRGFGFVNYDKHEEALKAIEEGSKISIGDDKTLFVDRFQKKAERVATLSKKFEDLRREKMEKYKNLNLYVKNLEDDVDDGKLRELFEPFGEISSAIVMKDDKGVSRGFGFVCFANSDDAAKALAEMHSKIIGAKPIYVNKAQRKEERQAQLEAQFQQTMASQRMHMPMFYPQAGMGMPPMMYPPQMMGRRPNMGQQMRNPYPPMYAGQPRRNGQAPRPFPQQRAAGAPPKMRGPQPGPRYAQQPIPMPSVAPPIPAHNVMAGGELTASALAEATPEAQKQMLGERLFPLVQRERHDIAGKITGMLLEMEVPEVLSIIENEQERKAKIAEAIEVLNQVNQ